MKDQSATPKSGAGRRGKYRQASPDPEVQAITNAAAPHSEEMRHRMIQYSITMGIRMVCIGLIFVFDGWFRLIPVAGAVVLPWVAVMIANGGADINHQETVDLLDEAPMYAVGAGEPPADDDDPSFGDILTGELVPDDEAAPEGAAPEGEAASAAQPDSDDGAVPENSAPSEAAPDETSHESYIPHPVQEEKHHEHL